MSGLDFEEAYRDAIAVDMDGIEVHVPSIEHLIRNKKASGRMKDQADAKALESLRRTAGSGREDS